MEGDDLFGDLLGNGKNSSATSQGAAGKKGAKTLKEPEPGKSIPADVFNSGSNVDERAPDPIPPTFTSPAVGREELHAVVSGAVQAAMDATFGKFVKSLRTVLEDLGKRVDSNSTAVEQLKQAVGEIAEQLDSQAQNFHSRFTGMDVSLKEVDRGVQAIRDRQELHEAQAMLAKLSTDTDRKSSNAGAAATSPTSPPAAAPVPAAPAPAPAAAPAAPAAAPAPAPPPAPVSAPAAALPPAPAAAPLPAPAPAPVPAPAPIQVAAVPMQAPQYAQAAPAPLPAPHIPDQHYGAPPVQMPAPSPQYYAQPASAPHPAPVPQGPPAQAPMPTPQHAPEPFSFNPTPYQQPGFGAPPPLQPTSSGPQHFPPPQAMPGPAPSYMGPPPSMPMASPGPQYPSHSSLSYPAPPSQSAYPAAPMYRQPSGPPHSSQPPQRNGGGGGGGGAPPSREAQTNTRSVRLDDIISDITAMGFQRHQIIDVINSMQKSGQAVDLNVVIDRLTNGRY